MDAEPLERKLAAILYADVAGYSRLTGVDEEGTHRTLSTYLDAITETVSSYHGKVLHYAGDAVLVEFGTVSDALTCAIAIQEDLKARNQDFPDDSKVKFRIGINLGEVIADRGEIYGDGVNVAARLESLAEPGGICISGTVYDAISTMLPLAYEFMGDQEVKNIAHPVRAYRARLKAGAMLPAPSARPKRRRRTRHFIAISAATAVVLAATVGVTTWLLLRGPASEEFVTLSLPDKPSIAVLPFANLSGDPEQEYFSDGMTDDLITDLSKVSGLFVIARNSSFAYKSKSTDVRDIARELGVRYVLEGSVRRAGDQIRINAQLIDATMGGNVWAERYDREYKDIFALQNEVIGKIMSALSVKLTDMERAQLVRRPTNNLKAYDYYLRAERGLHIFRGRGRQEALSLYEKAIELDPNFANAYAGIAQAAAAVWRHGTDDVLPGPVARERAYEAVRRALELDPHNSRAYSVLSQLLRTEGQHDEAIGSAQKAVSLDPNNARAYTYLAGTFIYAGRHAEALAAIGTAFRLEPKPPPAFYADLGWVLFWNRRYEEAIGALEKSHEGGVEKLTALAMTYAQLGELKDAGMVVSQILEVVPFANLNYYRVRDSHYKRKEDLEHLIDSLSKAGIPEWPFGYKGQPEDRLSEHAIKELTFGQTWIGHGYNGGSFIQQTSKDGKVAFRDPTSLLAGTVWVEGAMLCYQYPAVALGRKSCSHLFRNPTGTAANNNEYVRVSVGGVLYFSVQP